jgi:hypothetical protein
MLLMIPLKLIYLLTKNYSLQKNNQLQTFFMNKFIATLVLVISAVATQAQISSATFGMMQARQIGPATVGGRITAIEGINNEPRTLYIGTAGGGVWKTTNAGVSFTPIFDKYCQSIGALAIDQQNPKTIFVGTGESNMRNTVSIGDGLKLLMVVKTGREFLALIVQNILVK